MRPTVKFVITDVHMGLGHDGLNEVIRAHKKKNPLFSRNLEGGLVLFINKDRTRAKLYAEQGEVIGYLRLANNQKITEKSVHLIPATFGGSVEFSSATKRAFTSLFTIEKTARVRPLDKTALIA